MHSCMYKTRSVKVHYISNRPHRPLYCGLQNIRLTDAFISTIYVCRIVIKIVIHYTCMGHTLLSSSSAVKKNGKKN